MRYSSRFVTEMALVVVVVLLTAQVFALDDDVGLPIHPKAIPSSLVRQSGKGEGTEWVQVHFKTQAPYEQVIRFYREKTGKNVRVSRIESGTLLNTLIMYATKPQDQININISSEMGKKVTQVEISRNWVPQ